MGENQKPGADTSELLPASEVKSKIMERIAKEVAANKASDAGQDFHVVTGDPAAGQTPVAYTYYKGGSYVKTS